MTAALVRQNLDPNAGSLPARLTSMAFRFVARQFRSKSMALRNTEPVVTFTFDDVPASACEAGARILERYGARGTFYVAGAGCGTSSNDGPPRASIEQLRKVWVNGHEIGCHTYSHPAIRYMSAEELGLELRRNESVLKKIDSKLVLHNFAYPYGDMSVRTKRFLQSRFDSCRSGHAGINHTVADLGALHAWPLDSASLDRPKIADLIARTVETCGWLIFYGHDVAEQPSRYGVRPELLECAVSTAKLRGCAITTIAGGLKAIGGEEQGRRSNALEL